MITFWADWSDEDQEWVGKCDRFSSLSHLAPTREEALGGILNLVADMDPPVLRDAAAWKS